MLDDLWLMNLRMACGRLKLRNITPGFPLFIIWLLFLLLVFGDVYFLEKKIGKLRGFPKTEIEPNRNCVSGNF